MEPARSGVDRAAESRFYEAFEMASIGVKKSYVFRALRAQTLR
jgi:hypothetical protein